MRQTKQFLLFLMIITFLSSLPTGCSKLGYGTSEKKVVEQIGIKGESQNDKEVPKRKSPQVKGIYLNSSTLGDATRLQKMINLCKTTELNTVVVDIKDDFGNLYYNSSLPLVTEIGAYKRQYDLFNVIKEFHENNIYVIGRIVCFKDPKLAAKKTELAYKSKSGGLWTDNNKTPWLNPFNKKSWQYIIDISKEVADAGVDEIQFDYVRFCNDGDIKNIDFGNNFDPNTKSDAISEFLKYADNEICKKKGVPISADIFGIAAITSADDVILGQNLEKIAKEIDYISPMIYPSHYSNVSQNKVGQIINNITFPRPDLDPYNVIFQSMILTKRRLEQIEGKAIVRPYLQSFTASWLGKGNYQKYGPSQIRDQIRAVYDAGYNEWLLWDPSNNYQQDMFEKG